VFAWGGLGQYSVLAIVNADYDAIQGFVLVAAAFSLGVYLILDVIHVLVDPRVRY
jgi:peptide/nickel transport system permease protein